MRYRPITIIYNPNSTGNSKLYAEELKEKLLVQSRQFQVVLRPTKYAGHAETLAYQAAKKGTHPLVISSSGDGGYNEVVNGLMKAQQEGASPVAGLLPAGNANDHYKNTHESDVVQAIVNKKEQKLDVLKISLVSDGKSIERYAHSYIGIGLTPQVAQELNKTKLNWLNEIVIVGKTLLYLKPSHILVKGEVRSYDSIVFSNIGRMAKILTLSKEANPKDGLFEMTTFHRRSKLNLMNQLIRSSTVGLHGGKKLTEYSFETVKKLPIQLDGEVVTADANSRVMITIEPKALRCII